MACLGTTFTATCTTANRIAYPRGLSSINNYSNNNSNNNYFRPSGSFSLLPTLPQPSTSERLSNRSVSSGGRGRVLLIARAEAKTMSSIEKSGIKIIKNPSESKLADLGVRSWPKWGCDPSKFPWTYSSKETCFLLKGKVKVYPDGSNEAVEIGAGDLVEFPAGMSCTWDVSETVDKHYKFD